MPSLISLAETVSLRSGSAERTANRSDANTNSSPVTQTQARTSNQSTPQSGLIAGNTAMRRRPSNLQVTVAVVAADSSNEEAVDGVIIVDAAEEAMQRLTYKWHDFWVLPANLFIQKKIGAGVWSAVFSVKDNGHGKKFALKATPMMGSIAEAAANNIAILRNLQHPNVVAYYDHFVQSVQRTKFLCVKMEYCKKRSLREYLASKQPMALSANVVRDFALQIASGLAYIHEKGYLHGDLRPENILCTADNQLKLTNFASTAIIPRKTDVALTLTGGWCNYAPPEWASRTIVRRALLPSEVPLSSYDMWSFGCVLSELVTSKSLQGDRLNHSNALTMDETALEAIRRDMNTAHRGLFSSLVAQLLDVDPDTRMAAPDAVKVLLELTPSSHRSFTQLLSSLRS